MLKILFVDDDAVARRNMAQRIDWNDLGWDLVYTARDGVDALEYMKENRPDIIISDIKMPIMDGIEMAKIARDYYPDLFFIFLSGYKEFEYAKQALALDAINYLNKPIDNSQLLDVLRRSRNGLIHGFRKRCSARHNGVPGILADTVQHADASVLWKPFHLHGQSSAVYYLYHAGLQGEEPLLNQYGGTEEVYQQLFKAGSASGRHLLQGERHAGIKRFVRLLPGSYAV